VQEARACLGLKQDQLGKLVGRSKRQIIRYEKGEPLPPAIDLAIKHLMEHSKGE
jgi:DNA-binding XRE family transcriptional regulator